MKNLFYLFMLCGFTTFISSCGKEEVLNLPTETEEIKADNEMIDKLINSFDNTVNEVLSSDGKISEKQIEELFIQNIEMVGVNTEKNVSPTNRAYSKEFTDFAIQIEMAKHFTTKEAYKDHLINLNTNTLNSRMIKSEKQILVDQIAFMIAFVDWMEILDSKIGNNDYLLKDCDGWWDCWGACVAGTLGGTITGGTVGGLAGAAVGTVTLPIIGTVGGGAVGTIGGAIGGGLTGAATFC